MEYFIGIDGGGTNSRLVAINKEGQELGRANGGSTNITSVTYDGVFANIKGLIEGFVAASGLAVCHCAGLCIGSAGASTGDNGELLKKIFCEIGFICNIIVMNDAELVLRSETRNEPGMIIISGTGSVGYALGACGNMIRVGGWGHIIDDGGSGYRIGMDAIHATMLAFDGRGEKTLLTSMVTKFFDINCASEILRYVYGGDFDKATVAKLVHVVTTAANQGDVVATQILEGAAKALIKLADALVRVAALEARKIVMCGGVILNQPHIRAQFQEHIEKNYPLMQLVESSTSAEMGAAQLAIK